MSNSMQEIPRVRLYCPNEFKVRKIGNGIGDFLKLVPRNYESVTFGQSEELEFGNFSVLFWGQISEPKWGLGMGVKKGHYLNGPFLPRGPSAVFSFSLPRSLPFTCFPRAFPLSLLLLVA